ncbi:SIS domain-containing protein [Agrobacterium vitis]|uniref:SIS domain-containing protein n=1 Tax=Agrobacterium vitis TaxID=373 RepID=UPI0012E92AC0|nr:SIS domain-containing protein [Agrobacterium vitis]MVA22182.1 SIS domain-containing protein [Agrobacterium vitis]
MTTQMYREIMEIPSAITTLTERSGAQLKEVGEAFEKLNLAALVTIGRGSSDHAAHFLKYAVELNVGIPVASLGPSLVSVYGARLKLDRCGALAVSQSGKSPDIVELAEAVRNGGAFTVAMVNTIESPLANASTVAIDVAAGPEIAVAATKSFVNSVVAGLLVIAAWTRDEELESAVKSLPEQLSKGLDAQWPELAVALEGQDSFYILGRGPSAAIAAEAALKCKETCELHAEVYSSAEVMHGPVSLVSPGFPILAFAARDLGENSVCTAADQLASKGANVFVTSQTAEMAKLLPFIATRHPLTDALAQIVPFYLFVESLSRQKGFNPDSPPSLRKITETR